MRLKEERANAYCPRFGIPVSFAAPFRPPRRRRRASERWCVDRFSSRIPSHSSSIDFGRHVGQGALRPMRIGLDPKDGLHSDQGGWPCEEISIVAAQSTLASCFRHAEAFGGATENLVTFGHAKALSSFSVPLSKASLQMKRSCGDCRVCSRRRANLRTIAHWFQVAFLHLLFAGCRFLQKDSLPEETENYRVRVVSSSGEGPMPNSRTWADLDRSCTPSRNDERKPGARASLSGCGGDCCTHSCGPTVAAGTEEAHPLSPAAN
ncbi:hypothetical protein OPV22_019030 [Ensete ventricosum]|uniref:Uncharacterized protein n=1 Tax=Ensete ventricosum TaxID=4639 RepID=A0AAV8QX80_ENSVE|nr:hypothetical protein OPV22_019030 [Ensete ventricosum]